MQPWFRHACICVDCGIVCVSRARGSQLVWLLGELVGVNAKGVEDLLTDFVRHMECT